LGNLRKLPFRLQENDMADAVRAVYENGRLRLLDAVDLSDGQEVQLVIVSERTQVQSALGDLMLEMAEAPEKDVDEAALLREIENSFRGQSPLSKTIIDERQEGP
jgi:predicted DNA-binding antitoxin AbrB/MazE fold protein